MIHIPDSSIAKRYNNTLRSRRNTLSMHRFIRKYFPQPNSLSKIDSTYRIIPESDDCKKYLKSLDYDFDYLHDVKPKLIESFAENLLKAEVSLSYLIQAFRFVQRRIIVACRKKKIRCSISLKQWLIVEKQLIDMYKRESSTNNCFLIDEIAKLVENTIDNVVNDKNLENKHWYSFHFCVILCWLTGKRISDICNLTSDSYSMLLKYGYAPIRIRKTSKDGKIQICRGFTKTCPKELTEPDITSLQTIKNTISNLNVLRETLGKFEEFCNNGKLKLPIPLDATRTQIYDCFDKAYRCISGGRSRPKGLAFHAFRRHFAGTQYLLGKNTENIGDKLDHSTSNQTNHYINSYLKGLLQREKKSKS